MSFSEKSNYYKLHKIHINFQWIIIITFGFTFYLINRFSLFTGDDYFYSFIFGTDNKINSFKDIIISQYHHYLMRNGRFLVHCIVQYFCSIGGIKIFIVLNSLIFIAFCWFTIKLVISKKDENVIAKTILVLFLIWIHIPVQGMTFLGNISHSVNYLWSATAIVLFFYLHKRIKMNKTKQTLYFNLILFLIGLVCGSLHESFSIGVSAALFLYYCLNINEFKESIVYLISGFFVGTCIVVLAPGNFVRLSNESSFNYVNIKTLIINYTWLILKHLEALKIFSLMIILLIILYIKYRKKTKLFIKNNYTYIISAIIPFLFVIFIAYTGEYQYTSIALFSIIVISKILLTYLGKFIEKFRIAILSSVILFFIISYISVYMIRSEVSKSYKNIVMQAAKSSNGIISGKYQIYHYRDKLISSDKFRNQFIGSQSFMGDKHLKSHLSKYLTNGNNKKLINCVLPFSREEIIGFCTEDNKMNSDNLYKTAEYPFFVVPIEDNLSPKNINIQIIYERTLPGKIRNKFINRSQYIYQNIQCHGYDSELFKYKNKNYVIVWNPYEIKKIVSATLIYNQESMTFVQKN